jgi:catalase
LSNSIGSPSWELTASLGMKLSRFRVKTLVSFLLLFCLVIVALLHEWSDFHRKDLYEAIGSGAFPKWKFGIQVIPASKEHDFDFDILDATKIWPEELVPLEEIGELVLDRTPEEFFPEVEQVAFCTSNVVPGIGFSDDPLLQGRNFSYFDTQISRLGVNWQEVLVRDLVVVW